MAERARPPPESIGFLAILSEKKREKSTDGLLAALLMRKPCREQFPNSCCRATVSEQLCRQISGLVQELLLSRLLKRCPALGWHHTARRDRPRLPCHRSRQVSTGSASIASKESPGAGVLCNSEVEGTLRVGFLGWLGHTLRLLQLIGAHAFFPTLPDSQGRSFRTSLLNQIEERR